MDQWQDDALCLLDPGRVSLGALFMVQNLAWKRLWKYGGTEGKIVWNQVFGALPWTVGYGRALQRFAALIVAGDW
jgi:hypothetical protein